MTKSNPAFQFPNLFYILATGRLAPRLGHNKAIWATAHRLCRLACKILHQGVRYIKFGNQVQIQVNLPSSVPIQTVSSRLLEFLHYPSGIA